MGGVCHKITKKNLQWSYEGPHMWIGPERVTLT